MRIDKVHLRDVGPFDELTLDFPVGRDPARADTYLITGPNGCGKSTILYAIAGAIRGSFEMLGTEHLTRRFRSAAAGVAVTGGGETIGRTASGNSMLDSSVDQASSGMRRSSFRLLNPPGELAQYATRATNVNEWTAPKFGVFAYSGTRSLGRFEIDAIREPSADPFKDSLSFLEASSSSTLILWIANVRAKQALAAQEGNVEDAEKYATALKSLEVALEDVVGEPVRFRLSYEPLAVRLRMNGTEIDVDLLPEGLKSMMSWVGDLLMRLDRIKWPDQIPLLERPFILLLDEVDVHLHPEWQRKLLPVIQRLFPKAQIIATTHSPFVVGSASDAHVYPLVLENHRAKLKAVEPALVGHSYGEILKTIFGVDGDFDIETESAFREFYALKDQVLGSSPEKIDELRNKADELGHRSLEVRDIVMRELRQVERRLGKTP